LRTRRVLEEGMAITIEPGCYFIDFLIEKSLNDPEIACYLNNEKVFNLFILFIHYYWK